MVRIRLDCCLMRNSGSEDWMRIRVGACGRAGLGSLLLLWAPSSGLAQSPRPKDLTEASLEQLMDIEVTSVSRKEQRISRVAAAIYVIGPEEIRRSGATHIPDLLRMVPGMDVSQIRAGDWAISARGFNGVFANKLLVLIDGRTVYSPAYSGVLWALHDVPLANHRADRSDSRTRRDGVGRQRVNGVINIITKSSKLTHGVLLDAAAGSQLAGQGLAQYGGTAGKRGDYEPSRRMPATTASWMPAAARPPTPGTSGTLDSGPIGSSRSATRSRCRATSSTARAARRTAVFGL